METNNCSGCGCQCMFRMARMSPAIAVGATVERLCDVCVVVWDSVASRPFFVQAERDFIAENKLMATYKAAMLGQTPKGGFAL